MRVVYYTLTRHMLATPPSARNFEEGWTREFVKGANSFTGQRLIELRIAELLQRFGAV